LQFTQTQRYHLQIRDTQNAQRVLGGDSQSGMNDYWNDPPDDDQPTFYAEDPEPDIEPIEPEPIRNTVCPHGRTETCDDCDHLSDLAYDSDRERRYFR
jgi:hypothetical protein